MNGLMSHSDAAEGKNRRVAHHDLHTIWLSNSL